MTLEIKVLGTLEKIRGTTSLYLSSPFRPDVSITYIDALHTSRVTPIMEAVERLESLVFSFPADRWAYFHFALRTGFLSTMWVNTELAGFQCLLGDTLGGCIWTTIVREESRGLGYAKMLSAVSLSFSKWWGNSITTCLGPRSIPMIRRSLDCARVARKPCVLVTANPFHSNTPKLVLRTGIPTDPWEILTQQTVALSTEGIPIIERTEGDLPKRFRVPSTDVAFYHQIAEDPSLREYFALEGWCEDGTLVFVPM